MARVNVYLPDELAKQAKAAGLNVSGLTQDAVRAALDDALVDAWLVEVARLSPTGVQHADVIAAVADAKGELEGGDA